MNKIKTRISLLLLIIGLSFLLFQCEKPEKIVKVSTLDIVADDISYTSALVKGEIIDIGDNGADDHGLIISEFATLDLSNSTKKSLGSKANKGRFEALFVELNQNTVYYYKAYAIDGDKEVLGGIKQFKTLETGSPHISTLFLSNPGYDTVSVSFEIIANGGLDIERAGILWSYDTEPTITNFLDSVEFDISGTLFARTITGLKCDTTFYFKAFAINSKGTTYGEEEIITTLRCPGIPELSTTVVTEVGETTATSGGTINFDGHSEIIDRGLCWSLQAEPSIADYLVSIGSGASQFTANLTGLFRNGTYFVRAYATNEYGTGYGNELSFTTVNNLITGTFTDIRDDTQYEWVEIGGQIWIRENLKYLPSVNPSSTTSTTEPNYYVYGYEGSDVSEAEATVNYSDYGVLYNWPAAMQGEVSSDENPSGVQGVCPTGWHLPSDNEYKELEMFLGLTLEEANAQEFRGTDQGSKLKSVSGWNNNGNGTDESGFNALAAGYRHSTLGFLSQGDITNLWTSRVDYTGTRSFYRHLNESETGVRRVYTVKENGHSVRCVMDETPGVSIKGISGTTTNASTINAEVVSSGSGSITVSGVVWNSSGSPTLTDSKISDGSTSGSYSSNITGLIPNTIYYVRAYATNEHGTAYSDEVIVKTMNSTVTDIDGNSYYTVIIGTQEWMAENLKTTKFNDGTDIPLKESTSSWMSNGFNQLPAYCWYNNDETANKEQHGALYSWYTASSNICPTGWHLPYDSEWTVLSDLYGGLSVSGGSLKKIGAINWLAPNVGANNESGFSAIGSGRRDANGPFDSILEGAYFWSATPNGATLAFLWRVHTTNDETSTFYHPASDGHSIRCLKD